MTGATGDFRAVLLGACCVITGHALPVAAQPTTPPKAAPGYTLKVFAAPAGVSAPDSIVAAGGHVWVGFGNGVPPDGSSGSSSIVEFNMDGSIALTLSVRGHNDGLRIDPYSGKLWVLENEDASPKLIVVDPATGRRDPPVKLHPVDRGGYDDAAFVADRVYISASNPKLDAAGVNRHPALVSMVATDSGMVPETVVSGDSLAINALTHEAVNLNLTDPDSLTVMPNGNILLDDQGDAQVIEVQVRPGSRPFLLQVPLAGGVQVDDTVFATGHAGTLYISDTPANTVYALTSDRFIPGHAYTASTGVPATPTSPAVPAFVGTLFLNNGVTVPIVTGLSGPHGMAFQGRGG